MVGKISWAGNGSGLRTLNNSLYSEQTMKWESEQQLVSALEVQQRV